MKIAYLAALFLLLASCKKPTQLNLVINIPGVINGIVNFKQANEIVLAEKIANGRMEVSRQLASPGYYTISVIDNNKPLAGKITYDFYLEQTDYVIIVDASHPDTYPKIATKSEIQNQLTDYYHFANHQAAALDGQIESAKMHLGSAQAAALSKKARADIYTSTRGLQKKRRDMDLEILKAFMTKYPQSKIGAHVMAQMYYPENAKGYNAVFEKFPANVRTSDDGLKISNKLNTLLGVMANAKAPEIVGNTPDGKPFKRAALKNKITLVEFWRSSHRISTLDHQKMVNGLLVSDYDRVKFGILSVSMDTSKIDWTSTIKKDLLKWLQVSDLKGDLSPNATSWNITKLPTYFLVDKNWRIVKADIELIDVDAEVHDYLKKHH